VREEDGASVGQAHAATAPLEQLLAQLSLQGLDAGGDRGLGELESLGCAAEALMSCHLSESF
jgi:hypothetical protein